MPEELRAAYRVLKNAGFLPPELEVCRQIRDIEELLRRVDDQSQRASLLSRINFLRSRSAEGRRCGSLRVQDDYVEKIAERLVQRRKT